MAKSLTSVALISLVSGCTQKPDYDFMQTNFKENRATFSMLAAVACEVGEETPANTLTIQPDTDKTQALVELAATVHVEQINYRDVNGNCTLAMPVFEDETSQNREHFAYRFNITKEIVPRLARRRRFLKLMRAIKDFGVDIAGPKQRPQQRERES